MDLVGNKQLLANPNIVFREEEDGAFLFDPETGDLKCLNPIGSVIWSLCDGSVNMDNMEEKIAERYPKISRETIHSELLTFLQDLFDMGYLGYQVSEDSLLP